MRKIVKVKRSFSALAKQFSRILLLDIFKYQTDSPSSNIPYWIFQKERTIDSKTHFYWIIKQAFLWQSHKHQNNSLTFFISDFHLIGPSFSYSLETSKITYALVKEAIQKRNDRRIASIDTKNIVRIVTSFVPGMLVGRGYSFRIIISSAVGPIIFPCSNAWK